MGKKSYLSIDDITKIAKAYDKKLKASDKRFQGTVKIIHEDGSVFLFEHAFIMLKEDWTVCFSEHCGFMCFHNDSLAFCSPNTVPGMLK